MYVISYRRNNGELLYLSSFSFQNGFFDFSGSPSRDDALHLGSAFSLHVFTLLFEVMRRDFQARCFDVHIEFLCKGVTNAQQNHSGIPKTAP